MIARELKIGNWAEFEYKGHPKYGVIKREMFCKQHPFIDGWLVMTENGPRHFKLVHMTNVKLVD